MKQLSIITFFFILLSGITNSLIAQQTASYNNWQLKDIERDSISGISLERLYTDVLKDKIGKEIIIAIIDTKINTKHKDLNQALWTNTDEIPNNGIDDDNNGYIDDIHGWNFLGNKNGKQLLWATYVHIRVLNAYDSIFKDKSTLAIGDSILYKKALQLDKEEKDYYKNRYKYVTFLREGYPISKKTVDSLFKHQEYTVKNLDSVYKVYRKKNRELAKRIYFMYDFTRYKMHKRADRIYNRIQLIEQKLNNRNYDERSLIIGDNPNDINDRDYGNNRINDNLDTNIHGTWVTGVLAANRNNNKGIKGVSNAIKIMPVIVQPSNGDVYDKDIALAIRYAVNNGAKVISYNSSKEISPHRNWVQEALQYADKHQVIFVKSAGNQSKNTDIERIYPNDDELNLNLTNFITVGAIGKKFNKYRWSNYGKKTVDLFAPGVKLFTTTSSGGYREISGTSMAAPLVAGVAALLFSYYPELTAKEVKEIILESTYKHKGKVLVNKKTKQMLSYDEMCTSGGFLNAYNAFLLAEEYVKDKK